MSPKVWPQECPRAPLTTTAGDSVVMDEHGKVLSVNGVPAEEECAPAGREAKRDEEPDIAL